VQDAPFFWDTIQLGSKHAHFFYENGLKWAILPTYIDSGHPPFFGYYLAICWSLFGKTLAVSHWVMLPFSFAIVFYSYKIVHHFVSNKWAYWFLPIVLLDPVLLGQMAMISPDICLLCFFLMALDGIFSKNKKGLAIGIWGLCLISMRGMMTAGALGVIYLLLNTINFQPFNANEGSRSISPREAFYKFLPFFPGYFAAFLFLIWHYYQTGWIGFHPQSSWSPAFERVGFQGFIKNVLVLGWRFFDFGRVGVWVVLIFCFVSTKVRLTNLSVYFILILFLIPSALLYQNLSSHRYFLVLFWMLHLMVFQWITIANFSDFKKKAAIVFLTFCMAGGNLMVNPLGISMDWDATLAHLPYHRVRDEMLFFLQENNINRAEVGTAFPNYNLLEMTDLRKDNQGMFAEKNLEKNKYILWSNVFNDFSKEEYDLLCKDWVKVNVEEKKGVLMVLFERK
jgi:hypothetical protein